MIRLYIYKKEEGVFKREETGVEDCIIDVLADDEDFTLTPTPTYSRDWIWDGQEWIKPELSEERKTELQERKWEEIKNERLKQITSGVYVPSVDKVFHTDDVSIIQYNNIGNMIALGNYEPIRWKVKDNTWLTLTVPLFKELQAAMVARTNEAYQVAEHHKAEMLKAEDPELYDFTTGWPGDPETEIAAP